MQAAAERTKDVIHPDRAFVVLQIQMVAGQQAGLSPGKKRVGAKPATNRPMSTKRSGLVPGLSALDPVGEGLALGFQLDRPRWGYLGSDRGDFVGFFQWTSSARSAPKRHSHHRSCSCRKPNDPSYFHSLPGVATPINPNTSSTQSNPRGASMTAPGRQSPSSSNTSPTTPGTDNGSGSITPGGGNSPTGPGGTVPGGLSSPTPTGNPTGPGGNGPGTTPTPTTGPNGGITPGQGQTPMNSINGGGPSSYSWPPGMVPYGDHPPFTTLAHMLSWKAPDESGGVATLKGREVSGDEEVTLEEFDITGEQPMIMSKGFHKKRTRRRDSL